ncbi:MAG TPA: Ppx/GppA phosphatase family protein [Polyangiaceae bacterium]|nr:Ppx/GppA phosphatase family protein [Polyangiaceae bacterium]
MRVATIDIGTNTTLLLVAECDSDGTLFPILERATITRLGEGVDRYRRLAPEAIARTVASLDEFASLVSKAGVDRIAIVGTSAMRDAAGGESLRAHVRSSFGVDAQVLSGQEEARLTFRGALSGLSLGQRSREIAVIDIGGGSTEVVVGQMGKPHPVLRFAESFDIGSVRLTERFVTHDPPSAAELDAIKRFALDTFRGVPELEPGATAVGVAGTVTTLAAVGLGIVPYDGARAHGAVLAREDIRATIDRLATVDLESRRNIPGMEPKRADVIVAGGIVTLTLLERWNAPALVVSDRGVRWGLAEELVRGPAPTD